MLEDTNAMKPPSIRIWGRASSSNVKKVLWLAETLGIAVDRIDAGLAFGVVNTPPFRALNPNGRVPVLQDGDVTLWESNAILRYLAMAYDGERFYPSQAAERASIDRWMDWQLSILTPVEAPLYIATIRTPVDQHDGAAIASGVRKLLAAWDVLEQRLAERPFIEGNRLTLADFALGPFAPRLINNPFIDVPDLPGIRTWYRRLQEDSGFRLQVDQPLE